MLRQYIPQGYKATVLGIIPQEWNVKFLGDLLSRCANGLTYDVSITSGIPVTRIETISTGEINYAKVGYIPNESGYEIFRMQKGDILYSHINSLSQIGKVAYYKGDKEIYHGMNLLLLRANESLDKQYLYYTLLTDHMRHMAQVIAKPAVNQASISTGDLKRVKIAVPPLAEQRKIAEVLGVWDEAIEKQARLIEKLALRKRALMQRLLSAKLRLPGFSEPWKKVKLGDVASIKTGNKNNEDKIANGQYPFFVRSSIVERINTYSYDGEAILIPGEGKIGEIIHYINGKFDYHQRVYKISDFSNCSGLFLYYYLMYFFGKQAINNSVKACVDSLRLSTFTNMTIIHPPISEQTAIAEVLTAADREIELAKEKLERLRRQKRGLMQQLLTGKKRI